MAFAKYHKALPLSASDGHVLKSVHIDYKGLLYAYISEGGTAFDIRL